MDLALDAATRSAVVTVLPALLDEEAASLRRGHWDAARLLALLVPDSVALLLQWLDDPTQVRIRLEGSGTWTAFAGVCRDTFGVDPDRDTTLTGAHHLRRREGPWQQVWTRFVEAPDRYPHLPDLLDRAAPETLFGDDPHPDSRPAWNAEQEHELRAQLAAFPDDTAPPQTLADLESSHAQRRDTVWAALGRAPLAQALGWLHSLAEAAAGHVPATGVEAIAHWYAERGHRIDDCAIRALAAVPAAADRSAVRAAMTVLYDPWLSKVSDLLQRETRHGYAGATGLQIVPGTCVVFVDGLRFDLGTRLATRLSTGGCAVQIGHRLAAFPTVTPCGQPAVAPLTVSVGAGPGMAAGDDSGRALSGSVFREALARSDVDYLDATSVGNPSGRGWTQTNDIDALGHAHDHKLADLLDHELGLVAERVETLLAAGWAQVLVVTDHGFLLPAGPAAKVELALHLTEGDSSRKPRVARLKAGQTAPYPTLPWTWDSAVTMVSAPSAAAFVSGTLYEHGGLSPQECVTPVLTVGPAPVSTQDARIEGLRWVGYRCRVDVIPATAPVTVEIRHAAGDPASRIGQPKGPVDGEAKILVTEVDAAEGSPVVVVLLDASGAVIHQKSTRVGEIS